MTLCSLFSSLLAFIIISKVGFSDFNEILVVNEVSMFYLCLSPTQIPRKESLTFPDLSGH